MLRAGHPEVTHRVGTFAALSGGLCFRCGPGGVSHEPWVINLLLQVWLAMVMTAVVRCALA